MHSLSVVPCLKLWTCVVIQTWQEPIPLRDLVWFEVFVDLLGYITSVCFLHVTSCLFQFVSKHGFMFCLCSVWFQSLVTYSVHTLQFNSCITRLLPLSWAVIGAKILNEQMPFLTPARNHLLCNNCPDGTTRIFMIIIYRIWRHCGQNCWGEFEYLLPNADVLVAISQQGHVSSKTLLQLQFLTGGAD